MNKLIKLMLFFLLLKSLGLSWAAPPPLPLAGDLTDENGQPLNETVTLIFSLSDSVNAEELWSEVHGDVLVVRGRFAVLLGAKKDLLNSDGSAMDFTQKKYIKVKVTRKDQEPYTLTPPLEYIPTLGAWQAETAKKADHANEAKNSTTFNNHQWNDIEIIRHQLSDLSAQISDLSAQIDQLKNRSNSEYFGKPYSFMSGLHPGCSGASAAMEGRLECAAAIFIFCKQKGYSGGFSQNTLTEELGFLCIK